MNALKLEEKTYSLYHGFRTKSPVSEISGLVRFTIDEAYDEIVRALDHFALGYLVSEKRTSRPSTVNLILGMIDESQREKRFNFVYACPLRDRMESWAIRNPEIIYLTLDYADVPLQKTLDYLTQRFGQPHIAKLKRSIVSRFPRSVVPVKGDIPIDDIEWIHAVEGEQIGWLGRR